MTQGISSEHEERVSITGHQTVAHASQAAKGHKFVNNIPMLSSATDSTQKAK